MFIKSINDCVKFTANDSCQIQESLHSEHDAVALPHSVAMATDAVGEKVRNILCNKQKYI